MTRTQWLIFAGLFGACIGSFLNVVIHRLPRGQSLVAPPSRCPRCGYWLKWYDNIPIAGWLLLGGRCRECKNRISIQYPIVELITALLFVFVVWLTPPGPLLFSRLLFVCLLIPLFAIDLEHQILPNQLTIPGLAAGFLLSFITPLGWKDSVLGVVTGAGFFYLAFYLYYLWRRVEGMGFGDLKMLGMIGAFLGWKAVLMTVFLSSLVGALFGGILMLVQRKGMDLALPYGTFLAMAAFAAMFVADPFLDWYIGRFWDF